MPIVIQLYVVGAWLIHSVSVYASDPHGVSSGSRPIRFHRQKVVWNNPRRNNQAVAARVTQESRRHFLKAAFGLSAAGLLL